MFVHISVTTVSYSQAWCVFLWVVSDYFELRTQATIAAACSLCEQRDYVVFGLFDDSFLW
jgi:hypothetical protein